MADANNQDVQQTPVLITKEEFEATLHGLMVSFEKKIAELNNKNEKLQGEVDALKAFASEVRKQKEISDIRAEARNQVLRELGYEPQSEPSSTNTNNNNKSSSCFDHLFDWKNPNRRGLFG